MLHMIIVNGSGWWTGLSSLTVHQSYTENQTGSETHVVVTWKVLNLSSRGT
jgi:hypothetical protein